MLLYFVDELTNKAQYTQIPLPSNYTNAKVFTFLLRDTDNKMFCLYLPLAEDMLLLYTICHLKYTNSFNFPKLAVQSLLINPKTLQHKGPFTRAKKNGTVQTKGGTARDNFYV